MNSDEQECKSCSGMVRNALRRHVFDQGQPMSVNVTHREVHTVILPRTFVYLEYPDHTVRYEAQNLEDVFRDGEAELTLGVPLD